MPPRGVCAKVPPRLGDARHPCVANERVASVADEGTSTPGLLEPQQQAELHRAAAEPGGLGSVGVGELPLDRAGQARPPGSLGKELELGPMPEVPEAVAVWSYTGTGMSRRMTPADDTSRRLPADFRHFGIGGVSIRPKP